MGRTYEVERPRYAEKVREYLKQHAEGTGARHLSLEAIAKGAGVSRTPLSTEADSCPIIAELLTEIVAARAKAASEGEEDTASSDAAESPEVPRSVQTKGHARPQAKPGLELLSERAIVRRIQDCKRQAEKAMIDWLGRHGSRDGSDDAGLAGHDLEMVLLRLRRIADDLGPLLELHDQRESCSAPPAPPAGLVRGGQTKLDL